MLSSVAFACIDFILNWRLNLFEIVTQSHTNTHTNTHQLTEPDINTRTHTGTGTDGSAWASVWILGRLLFLVILLLRVLFVLHTFMRYPSRPRSARLSLSHSLDGDASRTRRNQRNEALICCTLCDIIG